MTGLHFTGASPFAKVHLTGLVRDAEGQKMSKTKGNVLDPVDLIDEYGADALRFTLALLDAPGRDIPLDPERIAGYRAFGNKLWNATRFALGRVGDGRIQATIDPAGLALEERWILSRLSETAARVDAAFEAFRFDLACNELYQFFWSDFCDWYIELAKPALAGDAPRPRAGDVLLTVLDRALAPAASGDAVPHRGALAASARPRGDPRADDLPRALSGGRAGLDDLGRRSRADGVPAGDRGADPQSPRRAGPGSARRGVARARTRRGSRRRARRARGAGTRGAAEVPGRHRTGRDRRAAAAGERWQAGGARGADGGRRRGGARAARRRQVARRARRGRAGLDARARAPGQRRFHRQGPREGDRGRAAKRRGARSAVARCSPRSWRRLRPAAGDAVAGTCRRFCRASSFAAGRRRSAAGSTPSARVRSTRRRRWRAGCSTATSRRTRRRSPSP